ncbi:unnamed protein product, partial [Linum tenue]
SEFDKLGAINFPDAINKRISRRKQKRVTNSSSTDASNILDQPELKEPNETQLERPSLQQQLLDDETRALQMELTNLLDAVQQTETMMVEISELNQIMSTHVLQQAQLIDHLYSIAVEATKDVELDNKELSQAT